MPYRFRGAAAVGAAATLALTAGCGLLGDDEEPASDQERLIQMLNESSRLESELSSAENRIIRSCLEEAGHTVHDEYELMEWAPEERDSLAWGYPHESFILDADEAAEHGFGSWAESPEAQENGEAEDYWSEQEEEYEDEEDFEEPDNSAFEALSQDEQWAWYVAYVGEAKAEEWYGYVLEEDALEAGDDLVIEGDSEAEGEGEEEVTDEGELEFAEDEEYVEPEPGGCQREMIDGLYGEPELVEHEWEEEGESGTWTEWSYRPENPEYDSEETMWEDIELAYQDRMIDLQYEFTDCLTEKGHAGWEFDEYGYLPIWDYFYGIYWEGQEEEEMYYGSDTEVEVPEAPEDLGDDYESKKAYEIEVAVAFTECDEELGYADASTEAYDEVNIAAFEKIEDSVYAWHEDMREAIERAQGMIDA